MLRKRFLFAAVVLMVPSLLAAQTYMPDVNDASAWNVVQDDDSMIDFGWDYSALGIPAIPGATDTLGIRMAANIAGPNPAALSASPAGLSLTAPFEMKFDMWLNYNSSGGTTEFGGGQIGFDATQGPINGVTLLGDTDGDSGRDVRIYLGTTEQMISDTPNYYAIASNNNSAEPLTSTFVGGTTPPIQTDGAVFSPSNVGVTAANGTLGYAWHQVRFDVSAAQADMYIDDLLIGSVPATDATLNGPVALTFTDIFSSVSTKPEFSFGVYDNVMITQVPEPNSVGLLAAALAAMALGFRRRR